MKITTAIETYLQASFDRPSKKERKYYVSDMGKCRRMRFFKRKGVITEFEGYVNWLLQIGNLYHDFGYKALEAQGLLVEAESRVETDDFSGRYDGIIKDKEGKHPFDFKSVGGYKMKLVMDKGETDSFDISQLLTYILLLQEDGSDISDEGFIVYINKEPSKKVPYAFFQRSYHLTDYRRRDLKKEMEDMKTAWITNKPPKCNCVRWMKDYNPFQPICQMTDKDIKILQKLLKEDSKIITTNKVLSLDKDGKRKIWVKL